MMCVLSHVRLFVTPWTVARGAPLCSWDFPGKNTGVGCPPPGDLPDPGIEPTSPVAPALQADSLPLSPPGKPQVEERVPLIFDYCY